jgi:16S rRNA G966 N2-methylase RsmD
MTDTHTKPKEKRLLSIQYRPVAGLAPYANNARLHSRQHIRKIVQSIQAFGFAAPILVDEGGAVLAGHGRLEAAKLLGLTTVPTATIAGLSDEKKRAFRLADNKIGESATWDAHALAIEFSALLEIDLTFDITVTGFETAEIDILLSDESDDAESEGDCGVTQSSGPPISTLGDLRLLGGHKLLCADARSGASFARLLGTERADLVFCDAPYNVPIDGHVSGLGQAKHAEFAMASGEMSESEFILFLTTIFENLCAHSKAGSVHFQCIDWRHLWEILAAARRTYGDLLNLCVWNKTNAGMGSLYRSKHELVFVFKNGRGPHINNVDLGKHGRYRTNVWDYPGTNSFGRSRTEDQSAHPTVKPVAMIADAVLDCSNRDAIVLDCFAGSGTILMAAERTGRRARAIEIDPGYVDVAIKRWMHKTGEQAVLADTGATFADIARERSGAGQSAGGPDNV